MEDIRAAALHPLTDGRRATIPTQGSVHEAAAGDSRQDHKLVSTMARSLAVLSPVRSIAEIGMSWLWIIAIVFAYINFQSPLAFLLAFALIAAKQYALLILLHDGQHSLLHPKRRVSDILALWLLAAPCGSTFITSRKSHLLHHQNLGDAKEDPEFFFYSSGDPSPKMNTYQFLRHLFMMASGGQIVHTLLGKREHSQTSVPKRSFDLVPFIPVMVVQSLIFGAFYFANNPGLYVGLWILPLVTLTVLLNTVRTFCDHAKAGPDVAGERLVTYESNLFERFFLAPYHMNYHAEHHLFPYIPHYHMPRLREILKSSPVYSAKIEYRGGYIAYILEFLRIQNQSRTIS